MKILTITCHDVYNFGASLQAYAYSIIWKNWAMRWRLLIIVPAIYIKNMIGNHLQVKSLISLIVSL